MASTRHPACFLSQTAMILLCVTAAPVPLLATPEQKTIDGIEYHILQTDPASVRILWKDETGAPLRTLPATARYLAGKSVKVLTLMNGGIFEPGGVPSGLLIQDSKMLNPVNREDGIGNFFLKPNGIFLIGSQGAAVIQTEEYPLEGVEIHYAVQSGPLLLRRGKFHPAFKSDSSSRLHRNGVGISKEGSVIFVMTDIDSPKYPNLFEFAQIFLKLGCEDALFLDGDLSQMRSGEDIHLPSNSIGSVIAVLQSGHAVRD